MLTEERRTILLHEARAALRADARRNSPRLYGNVLHAVEYVYYKAVRAGCIPRKTRAMAMVDIRDVAATIRKTVKVPGRKRPAITTGDKDDSSKQM